MEFVGWFFVFMIVLTTLWFVIKIVRIGTRYSENIERIKRGYPTLEGDKPLNHAVDSSTEDFFSQQQQ